MTNVRVDDFGEQARIERLAVFLTDLRSFWPLLVPVATGWWSKQFDTSGEFGGQQWAPLSAGYEAWKSVNFPGKGILQRTGDMRRAASNPSRSVTPTTLTLTIESDVLPYHEFGTANMPQRPLVFGEPLPAEAQAELDAVAEHYIEDLLRRV